MADQKYIQMLMKSDSYKDQFRAEYFYLKSRIDKLKNMRDHMDIDHYYLLPSEKAYVESQLQAMQIYLFILERRAEVEGIDIKDTGLIMEPLLGTPLSYYAK